MSDNTDRDDETLYVVFLDSFGHGDLEYTPWMRKNLDLGRMDAGPVYVTPVALGSIYTGMNPAEHGLPSVSKHDTAPRQRPAAKTLPEAAVESEEFGSVVNFGLPFIVPPDVDEGDSTYLHSSGAMGGNAVHYPEGSQNQLSVTGPAGDLSKPDENFDSAFEMRRDYTYQKFGTARQLAYQQDADVVFIGYRTLDSYCHYKYTETPDDEAFEETYRQMILREVDKEVKYLYEQEGAEVFVFGDHGAMEMDNVFRVNRWLMENGYLEADLNLDTRTEASEKAEWLAERGFISEEDAEGMVGTDPSVPGETLTDTSPGVEVDYENSVAMCSDPFSGGISLLEGANEDNVEEMIEGLENQAGVDRVFWPREEWSGPLIEECPDLYVQRTPGTFVSGNLHPDMGGAEITRDGVHHPIANYGSTLQIPTPREPISADELFDVICEAFLRFEPDVEATGGPDDAARGDQEAVREHLEDLGYL